MIKVESFSKEWLTKLRKDLKFRNSAVAEKMIHAIALVEALVSSQLDFILKGGTSLIFLIESMRRFSIDVDIVTQVEKEEVENTLSLICGKDNFHTFEYDERRSFNSGIPKAHYKIFYTSKVTGKEDRLLLDILFEENKYPKILSKSIKSPLVSSVEPVVCVQVPSKEAILGDKLTAFAPTTTGILFGKNKELEIAKQLFDIGVLFDHVQDISEVRTSFLNFVYTEIEYRNLKILPDDVLKDAIKTAFLIASKGTGLSSEADINFKELIKGYRSLNQFLINGRFTLDEAILASAKASLIAMKVMKNDLSAIVRFAEQSTIDYLIENPQYNFLNKLKKIPGGVLFYWNKTVQLLEG